MARVSEVVLAIRDAPRDRKAIDAKIREVLDVKRDPVLELVRTDGVYPAGLGTVHLHESRQK